MNSTKAKILVFTIFSFVLSPLFGQGERQVFTFPNGQVSSEGFIRDGKPDGYWKTYYENGQLKSEGNRVNFLLEGIWYFYTEEGDTLSTISYSKDLKNGLRRSITEYEVLVEPFVKDVRSGEGGRYDRKGHLLQRIFYKNGFEEGNSPVFDTTGLLKEIITYRKGFIVNREILNQYDGNGKKQGYWKTFFDDWSLHTECYYKHGLRDGFYKEYDEKGNLKKITKYVNDVEQVLAPEVQPLQMQYEYYDNGRIKREASFRNGKKEGTWRVFDETGKVIKSQTYEKDALVSEGIVDNDGKRRGDYKEFYADSTLKTEGFFIDGERSGVWKYYFHNGQLEETGTYRKGFPDGLWIWFYDNGKKQIEENFLDGLPSGSYKEYDLLGNVIVTGTYFDGMKVGKWTEQIGDMRSEGEYRNDKKIGEWVSYYDDGKLEFRGKYDAGYPNGEHYYYYPNGRIRELQTYAMGVAHGEWKKYLDTGELYFSVTYRQGAEVKYDGELLPNDDVIRP
ncbi:MAG: toxin-antitoxin system YwqK family antitoxin [Bacteroidales bacterium]|nr:toxin-antitoxin system YwqK family antitoxin [Bacteroidales bacterium]